MGEGHQIREYQAGVIGRLCPTGFDNPLTPNAAYVEKGQKRHIRPQPATSASPPITEVDLTRRNAAQCSQ